MNVWKWSHEDRCYHRGHVKRLCDRCPKVRTCSYGSEIINVKELMRLIEKGRCLGGETHAPVPLCK